MAQKDYVSRALLSKHHLLRRVCRRDVYEMVRLRMEDVLHQFLDHPRFLDCRGMYKDVLREFLHFYCRSMRGNEYLCLFGCFIHKHIVLTK